MFYSSGNFFQLEASESQMKSAERKMRTSKLKSLRNYLEIIIQKKVRLDIEIKRTKEKISKIKESSKTEVKTSLSLENFDYDSFSNEDREELLRRDPELFQELFDLDEQIFLTENLLSELEELQTENKITK